MNKKNTDALKEYAIAIHAKLNTHIRHSKKSVPPPLSIEIAGHPSCGKSTMIGKLDTSLRRLGFKVGLIQEGAQAIRNIARTSPEYNIVTAAYSINKLYEALANTSLDIVIFERCVFDAYNWPRYWAQKGELSQSEVVDLQNYYLFHAQKINVAFFVVCDPNLAVLRESKILSINQEGGGTTNTKTIEMLKRIFEDSFEKLRDKFPQLHILDTTNLTEQEMVDTVTEIILTELAKK